MCICICHLACIFAIEFITFNKYVLTYIICHRFYFFMLPVLADIDIAIVNRSCQKGLYRYGLSNSDPTKQPRSSKTVLVPSMAKSSGWLGNRIGQTLKDYGPAVHKKGMVSKSLRQGSITNMSISRNVTYDEKLARSGHAPADSTKYYNQPTLAVQLSSANVLSGHETTDKIRLPTLQALSDHPSYVQAERVMNELYKPCSIGLFMEGGALRPLMRYVFASAVKHYNAKVSAFGRESAPIDAMIQAAIKAGVASDSASAATKLGAWSTLIAERYHRDNQGTSSDTTDRDLIVTMSDNIKELLRRVHGQEARLATVESNVSELKTLVGELERGIKRSASTAGIGDDHGPRRRARNQASTPSSTSETSRPRSTSTSASTRPTSNAAAENNTETPGLVRRATRMLGQSLNFGASASGNSTATNEVKDILRELVEGGLLCDGAALPNTWLSRLDKKERARYIRTMELVEQCWTPDQQELLRKKEHTDPEKSKLDDMYEDINTAVLVKMNELEGHRNPTETSRQKASYIRVGIRYGKHLDDQNKRAQPSIFGRVVNVLSPGRSRRRSR